MGKLYVYTNNLSQMFRGKIKNTPFNAVLQKITSYDFNVGCVHAINYSYIGASRVLDNVVDKEGIVIWIFSTVNAGKLSSYMLKMLI